MALDEPKDNDLVKQEDGYSVVADKTLLEKSGGLLMDYHTGPFKKGFHVRAKNPQEFSAC